MDVKDPLDKEVRRAKFKGKLLLIALVILVPFVLMQLLTK